MTNPDGKITELLKLSDAQMKAVLKEIGNEPLIAAIVYAPKEVIDKVCAALSKRGADLLRDSLVTYRTKHDNQEDVIKSQIFLVEISRRVMKEHQ